LSIIRKAYNSIFSDDKELSKYVRAITGITPSKIKIYKQVFRHRSAYVSAKENNERLELLGDSVLDLLVAEFLFKKYPFREEGFMTEMRAKIVNRASLNVVGQKLGLTEKLEVNRKGLGDAPKDLAGNTFEALVGAIYLDAGLDAARRFVHKRVLQNLVDIDNLEATETDHKSKVFHYSQRNGKKLEFVVNSEEQRNRRSYFVIDLTIDGQVITSGEGYSKKNAEQAAAMKALALLKNDETLL
jgi:ribonuclease-3